MGSFRPSVIVGRLQPLIPVIFLSTLALYALWPWLALRARAAEPRTLVVHGLSFLGDEAKSKDG